MGIIAVRVYERNHRRVNLFTRQKGDILNGRYMLHWPLLPGLGGSKMPNMPPRANAKE
jgi:hypothetical protein